MNEDKDALIIKIRNYVLEEFFLILLIFPILFGFVLLFFYPLVPSFQNE